MSRTEFTHFRKRVTSLILATDMEKHASKLSEMKQIIQVNNIKETQDISKWLVDNKEVKEVDEV